MWMKKYVAKVIDIFSFSLNKITATKKSGFFKGNIYVVFVMCILFAFYLHSVVNTFSLEAVHLVRNNREDDPCFLLNKVTNSQLNNFKLLANNFKLLPSTATLNTIENYWV